MASTSPKSLTAAGNLLIAAGFVAAFTGGLYGLALGQPGMVVLAVLLVIGYSVAGYLLLARREAAFTPAVALAGVLVIATLFVFRPEVARFLDAEFAYLVVFPALGCLLAFAAAHLLAYAMARRNPRVLWPSKGTEGVSPLLAIAAVAPVLNAFLLLYVGRASPSSGAPLLIALSVLASIATAMGGVVSSIRRHPQFTLAGASIGFLANVYFLFQFAPLAPRDYGYWGQLNALAGMLLCGFPIAMAVVAWVELDSAKKGAHSSELRAAPAAAPSPKEPIDAPLDRAP